VSINKEKYLLETRIDFDPKVPVDFVLIIRLNYDIEIVDERVLILIFS